MDYYSYLKKPLKLHYIDDLVQYVLQDDKNGLVCLLELVFSDEKDVAWRAAWACQKISENQPDWFSENDFQRLSLLLLSTPFDGVRRGVLSVLNYIALPIDISVELINFCFDAMLSPRYPVAIQCLSMKLMYRICLVVPDLANELHATLCNVDPLMYTPGFRATRKNVLKCLKI